MATMDIIEELKKIPNIFNRREYGLWKNMLEVCYDKSNINYKYFGGKGIEVYELWKEKKRSVGYLYFIRDMGFVVNRNIVLKRINTDRDFKPSNCVWSDKIIIDTNSDFNSYNQNFEYSRNANGNIAISIDSNGIFKHLILQ